MSVFGEFVSSVKAEDTNKTGYTLNYYVSSGGPRGLFAYSQSKAGKGDGPYVEFYRTGAVRALFWFKDGLLTQGKIWETNGILQESKVFNPAIDILKEGALFRAAKHK